MLYIWFVILGIISVVWCKMYQWYRSTWKIMFKNSCLNNFWITHAFLPFLVSFLIQKEKIQASLYSLYRLWYFPQKVYFMKNIDIRVYKSHYSRLNIEFQFVVFYTEYRVAYRFTAGFNWLLQKYDISTCCAKPPIQLLYIQSLTSIIYRITRS